LKGELSLRVIGLTGGIACGKSLVSSWLADQPGCAVVDGDLLSRELTAPGGSALPAIRECFGDSVFNASGALNRRALGRIVFSDSQARSQLDQLMAPLLRDLTLERLRSAEEDGYTLCFLDFPLLFEKGYDQFCDTVWCVTLPRSLQLKRLMERDHLTEEEALQRMDAVLSTEEKASRSQVVIDNSSDRAFTLSSLPPLLEAEKERERTRHRRRSQSSQEPSDSDEPGMPASFSSAVPSTRAPGSFSGTSPDLPSGPMERPVSARRKTEARKAPWKLPVWLISLLSVALLLVMVSVTSLALMNAYLTRQAEKHLAEDRAIHTNYPLEYRQIIEDASAEFNLNPAFVSAIIRNESSFQPRAESSVGARGLMQLMPDTAEWIAGKMKVSGYAFDRMYDPESNVRFGCWYLRFLSSLFHGDPICVACAYHAGQGQVTAWLSDSRYSDDGISLVLSRLSEGPTKSYAGKVIRAYGIYQELYYPYSHRSDGDDSALDSSQSRER